MDYIYAGTKARTLETTLLTDTQLEVLLGSSSLDDFYRNLQDTFLAPYLADAENDTPFSHILERVVTDTKQELATIAPEPHLLDILWIKYDYYNLRALIKGEIAGLDDIALREHCFTTGIYDRDRLIAAFRHNEIGQLDERLADALKEARQYTTVADIDLVMNLHYLTTARSMAHASGNMFVIEYVTRLIDLFNVTAALRTAGFKDTPIRDIFIEGGTFHRRELTQTEDALQQLNRIGGPERWREAREQYQTDGSFALIEKTKDDYMNQWLKEQSYEIFSPAALFAYFTAVKNNVQLLRAIHVGKDVELEEHEIRQNLRTLYQ